MISGKSKRVVPVPDRRRGKRIVTLKNFRNASLVVLALFVIASIRSEMRGKPKDDYGRIVSHELPAAPEAKPMEVISESAGVRDETSADTMLIQPAARAQFLGDTTLEPIPLLEPQTSTVAEQQRTTTDAGRVVIVGGMEGVSIVRDQRPQTPKLGGGFGRQ